MFDYEILKKAFIIGLENEALNEWDSISVSEKQIYKDKHEFLEVRTREAIHRFAVDFGLMK